MSIKVNSNISALSAVRSLDRSTRDLSTIYDKLSTGLRINKASDDAAGLSIASALNVDSRVYAQSIRNVNDGISLISIAEGAMDTLKSLVTRVSELAEQAASGTFAPRQRVALDREADTLMREYNRIIRTTSFNGIAALDGTSPTITLQHGYGDAQSTAISIGNEMGVAAGDGTFLAARDYGATGVNDVTTADVNGDGIEDLIGTVSGGTTNIFIGNGDGTFQ